MSRLWELESRMPVPENRVAHKPWFQPSFFKATHLEDSLSEEEALFADP